MLLDFSGNFRKDLIIWEKHSIFKNNSQSNSRNKRDIICVLITVSQVNVAKHAKYLASWKKISHLSIEGKINYNKLGNWQTEKNKTKQNKKTTTKKP